MKDSSSLLADLCRHCDSHIEMCENCFIKDTINRFFQDEEDHYWLTVHKGEVGYSRGDFRCPVCNQVNPCYQPTNYCANCGTRMKGVKPRGKGVSDR